MRIITDVEVETLILPRLTLSWLLHSQALAFHCLSSRTDATGSDSGAQCPPRLSLRTPSHTQLFMPARTHTPDSVIKIVSVPRASPSGAGASGISGVNLVFSDATGRPSHVVGSSCLTALRTAAGSLMSSILALGSARRTVERCVVFGDGAQALFHVWLHMRYFTRLVDITVVVGSHRSLSADQVKTKGEKFKTQLASLCASCCATDSNSNSNWSLHCIAAHDSAAVQSALQQASLVFTCTPSTAPLFPATYLAGGARGGGRKHICAVGSYTPEMCELPQRVVLDAMAISGGLTVDSVEACLSEAGCLLQAQPDKARLRERCVELAKLLPATESEGNGGEQYLDRLEEYARQPREEMEWGKDFVSVFKSVGVGLQDVEVTNLVVALAGDAGTEVAF